MAWEMNGLEIWVWQLAESAGEDGSDRNRCSNIVYVSR